MTVVTVSEVKFNRKFMFPAYISKVKMPVEPMKNDRKIIFFKVILPLFHCKIYPDLN